MGLFDPLPPQNRNPRYSALLSAILPGLGQVYNYQVLKGFIFMFVFIFFISLVIPAVMIWIATIYDAYNYANKLNGDILTGIPADTVEGEKKTD